MTSNRAPKGESADYVGENWSGREDSNLRPLPPEECSPAQTGGIQPFISTGEAGTSRESRDVAGTVTGTTAQFYVQESTMRKGTFNVVDRRKVVAVEMYLPRDTALAKCARRNGEAA